MYKHQNLKIMATWRITVKTSGCTNGVRLEKGMFVDMVTKTSSRPINSNPKETHPIIAQLFMNKYGVDVMKANAIAHMSCDKIG